MAHDPEEVSGRAFDRNLLRRLLRFALPYRREFMTSTGMLLCISAMALAGPLLLRDLINGVLSHHAEAGSGTGSGDEALRALLFTSGVLLVLGILTFALRFLQIRLTNRTGQRVIHDLRTRLYDHITKRSLKFFDQNPVGKLVTRVTSDIETLNEFFVAGIDVLLYDLVRIIGIVAILFIVDWQMALVTLSVVPLILAWSFVFQRRARRLFRVVRGEVGKLNASLNEYLSGVRLIQSLRREKAVLARFSADNRSLKNAHVATVWNFAWFFPGLELLPALGTAMLLVVGHSRVREGDLQVGDVIMFWTYLGHFLEPLRQVADKYNVLQGAVAAGERVFRVLDDETALPLAPGAPPVARVRGAVSFRDVHFAYDDRKPVLKGISFEVPAGSKFALVGPTGSGKSTIISLLSRFYDPTQGVITLDGQDLRTYELAGLRRQIGVVLQDVFLFEGTVRENLHLGRTELTDEALLAAASAVQALPVVERLGGLSGHIQERGSTLSVGEKQLLAFARTMAHDPAVLVLDEATAHIDTATELLVQSAIARLTQGRTTLAIAHRLSTIQSSDCILVLHHGELRERGTHEQLLHENGIYARLSRLQSLA